MCKDIWIKANLISFLGLISTVVGIWLCFVGRINYGVILLLLSGICDGVDGEFAKRNRKKTQNPEYGIQLDSLADIVCSGVFPIVICLSLGFVDWYFMVAYCIFLICGITRLTYYNVNSSKEKYFKGVPITVSTFVIPFLFFITRVCWAYLITILLLSMLYVLNIKISKPTIKFRLCFSIIAIILVIVYLYFYL